jgi:hypothetical protein
MSIPEIKIDRNSNLYINNHWISIDKNNELEALLIENKVENTNENKLTIIEKLDTKVNRKLQAKLIDDEISKFMENDEECFDDDEDIDMISNYIYNPETKFINYHEGYNSDDDNYDNIVQYYDINGIVEISDNILDLSNYEFYYFGLDSNDLKYYTRIVNDNPIYRISYYENSNELSLNIIGDSIKRFKIIENKENNILRFEKINKNMAQNI